MTALLDFAIAFVVLLAMMLVYGVTPAPQIVLLPVFVALACADGARLRTVAERAVDAVPGRAAHGAVHHPALAVLHAGALSVVGGGRRLEEGAPGSQPDVRGRRRLSAGASSVAAARALRAGAGRSSTIVVVLGSSLYYFQRVERTLADRI